MAIIKDPEGSGLSALLAMADFKDLNVLEIGCGEGKLIWGYAGRAARVTAIDPDGEAIATAQADLPEKLKGRVQFFESTLEDFAESYNGRRFDIAIFSWSL